MRALLIDAYDSFVYIIRQYLLEADVETLVVRNDKVSITQIEQIAPDFIVLGPGPGHPADAHYVEIIKQFGPHVPTLGVCLGHQAICLAFGGSIEKASHLMHGKGSPIEHDRNGVFRHSASPFIATRYHSLIAGESDLPSCLKTTARSLDDNYIMGLRHETLPIEGVQFHPESICTENGLRLFQSFIEVHVVDRDRGGPL